MPIYEYLCQSCAHRFEVKQGIKDDPIKVCTRCGEEVSKLISSPAIMFKGSGWYVTDYSDKLKPTGGTEGAETSTGKNGEGQKKSEVATPAANAPAGASSSAEKSSSSDGSSSSSGSAAPAGSSPAGSSTPASSSPSSSSS